MKNFETADTDTDMTFYDFGVIQTEIDSGSRYGEYVQLERAIGKRSWEVLSWKREVGKF